MEAGEQNQTENGFDAVIDMNSFEDGAIFYDGVNDFPSSNSATVPMEADADFRNDDDDFEDEYDCEFDEEVDKLLEESLAKRPSEMEDGVDTASLTSDPFANLSQPPTVKQKIVLKHRGMEYFEVLPDGWIEVTHSSGVPVYLHKSSRVCSLSRPYFIGPGSVRNHDVPISAIPCYYQRKLQEWQHERQEQRANISISSGEAEHVETMEGNERPGSSNDMGQRLEVKVQTVDDFKKRNLKAQQLHEYCSGVFQFETINVMRFKSWSDHRAYRRCQKQLQNEQELSASTAEAVKSRSEASSALDIIGRPSLPANIKLITVPDMEKGSKPQQKQFFLNPQGKTSIAVLHEYVQKVMKGSVHYQFSETRNAANPYCAVVKIVTSDRQKAAANGKTEPTWTEYGKGEGSSKKNAKLNAAKQALRVLVPGVEFNEDGVADLPQQDEAGRLFDLIGITDSRVPELSAKAGQPTPFVILQECLKRHSAFGNTSIDVHIKRIRHQQHDFTMTVGKHEVKVQCTNKKEGKQRAAQAMLEKLHPQIKTWGSLIRLYGYGAQRKLQETRKEKDSIIKLQVQSKQHSEEPNAAILDKLRQEMLKLYDQMQTSTSKVDLTNASVTSAVKSIDI